MHVRYVVTHQEGHCPATDADALAALLENLGAFEAKVGELSEGKAKVLYQEYDRNAHTFAYGLELEGLHPHRGGDFIKKALGLKHVTVTATVYETAPEAAKILTDKLADLRS